jgi:hypothetical protein
MAAVRMCLSVPEEQAAQCINLDLDHTVKTLWLNHLNPRRTSKCQYEEVKKGT